jgi:hypothetical protein
MASLTNRLAVFSIAIVSSFLIPDVASACANCFAASSRSGLKAYYISTAILTLMPFVLIAAIAFIGYKSRQRPSLSIVHRK